MAAFRPDHRRGHRRRGRRAVRYRYQVRRPARADRGDHRRGQVRAAADADRVARGGEPAGLHDVRAHRLQGRQRVQGLREAPAHRRNGQRPRRAPDRTGAGIAIGRAEAAEEILLRAGAKDIEDYWDARRASPGLPPLPRLVLVIDEFASLVAELPDFVSGLVGIAQRGRSLGVHLILATQRPAGVVSADIRANANLRIALRVTDVEESADVIDSRDAAFIARSTPGRCWSGPGRPRRWRSSQPGSGAVVQGQDRPRRPRVSSPCRGPGSAARCRSRDRPHLPTRAWSPTCRSWWTPSPGPPRPACRSSPARGCRRCPRLSRWATCRRSRPGVASAAARCRRSRTGSPTCPPGNRASRSRSTSPTAGTW